MSEATPNIQLEFDEQATLVMIYTTSALLWGQMVTKEAISAGRVLLGVEIPDYLTLFQGQMVMTNGGKLSDRFKFAELSIPSPDVLGFHVMPPKQEPIDYDPDEPNRKMTPVTAFVGDFRFNGVYRISAQSTFSRTLGSAKATFFSFYDVEIRQTLNPNAKAMRTGFALVRRGGTIFAQQTEQKE